MTLHYPIFLLLLLAIPLLVFLRYRRRRQASLRFSDGEALARLRPSLFVLLQPILPILYALGMVLLVLCLCRPQRGLKESLVRTEAIDIVLVVDVSTSMLAEDLTDSGRPGNRLDAAKKAIERFVARRPNDRIGMVAFSAFPYSISPLTLDHHWLLERLNMESFRPGMLEDGTAIGDGVASAINRLRNSDAKSKVIILLTDGVNNAGTLSPVNAAQAAQALGIKVYTVGAGTSGWVKVPVQDPFMGRRYMRQFSEIDEATLQQVADVTGAEYFRAEDYRTLEKVYDQIDVMEKTDIEVDQFTKYEEAFSAFLATALLFLLAEKLLALTRLGRLP